jgi:hypothetical protein
MTDSQLLDALYEAAMHTEPSYGQGQHDYIATQIRSAFEVFMKEQNERNSLAVPTAEMRMKSMGFDTNPWATQRKFFEGQKSEIAQAQSTLIAPGSILLSDFRVQEQDLSDEIVKRLTQAMREADRNFEKVGGSTRHHVRDCLIPILKKYGLLIQLCGEET